MIQPVILYGDPILRSKSENIDVNMFPIQEIGNLTNDMFETMHKANGVGLSAIQIGVPFRIFVIEINNEHVQYKNVFINPNITHEFGEMTKLTEGCLSIPHLSASIERRSSLMMEYYNEKLEYHQEEFGGLIARVIQHEYDHLDGILYTDRVSLMWKDALEEPLNIIKNRKISVPYLSK